MTSAENRKVIGVDLGGTKVATGLISDRTLLKKESLPITADGSEETVIKELEQAIEAVIDEDVRSIGIGVPSVVDTRRGIVYDVQNIPSWKEVHLKKKIEDKFQLPVRINNDANCFALGEKYFGYGTSYENFVGLIVGTGLAAGLIIDGKMYEGYNCGAGEFGEIPYLDHNFEYYCSGQYFENVHQMKGEEVHRLALKGDNNALSLFHVFGRHLGDAVKAILLAMDPECIIFGGSVSKTFSFFERSMWNRLQDFPYRNTLERIEIKISDNPDIAILGAAALCLEEI